MINALMCVYKSADVLKYSIPQLLDCPYVTRILVADGPHIGTRGGLPRGGLGPHCEQPTVKDYIGSLASGKIVYEYTDNIPNRAQKNNSVLRHTSSDCQWILCVDSDEVYHEDDLESLVKFLKSGPEYGRYRIPTIDLFPDFHHRIKIKDSKCRLYSYKKGYNCRAAEDRAHQFVDGPGQKHHPTNWRGMEFLPENICKLFHLNALRTRRRLKLLENGDVSVRGGKRRTQSSIYPWDIAKCPKVIRESGLDTILNLDGKKWDDSLLNYVSENE